MYSLQGLAPAPVLFFFCNALSPPGDQRAFLGARLAHETTKKAVPPHHISKQQNLQIVATTCFLQ